LTSTEFPGKRVKLEAQDNEFVEPVASLPIAVMREDIVETIMRQQVTVVSGETGCGKSTQIPQYILERDPNARIICTQPRRIAAINLAYRVQDEMLQKTGTKEQLVGHHIRGQMACSESTRILYVTTGIFLSRLVHQRERLFEEFPYIVLDEVHERDTDSDFALIAIKHLLAVTRRRVRVVIMSATLNVKAFLDYFSP
jgi:HrpA-like RNA helicase